MVDATAVIVFSLWFALFVDLIICSTVLPISSTGRESRFLYSLPFSSWPLPPNVGHIKHMFFVLPPRRFSSVASSLCPSRL